MTPESPRKRVVFISYSSKDREPWLSKLGDHLSSLELEYPVEIWSDVEIEAGDRWREKIDEALASASIFVLLVSARFIASRFVTQVELPRLLKAAKEGRAVVLPVMVSYVRLPRINDLPDYQAINDPEKPLIALSEGQQEEVFTRVSERIAALLEENVTPQSEESSTPQGAAEAVGDPAPSAPLPSVESTQPAATPRPRLKPAADCMRYAQTFGLHIKHQNSVIILNYALIILAAVVWLAVVMFVVVLGDDLGLPQPWAVGGVIPFLWLAYSYMKKVADGKLNVDKCRLMKGAFDSGCATWSSVEFQQYKREADDLLRAVSGVNGGRQET